MGVHARAGRDLAPAVWAPAVWAPAVWLCRQYRESGVDIVKVADSALLYALLAPTLAR